MRAIVAIILASLCAATGIARAGEPATLTLSAAIATAEAHSPDALASAAQTQAAIARLRAAQGDRMPSLTLSDTYQYADPVATLQTPIGPLPFSPNSTNVPLLSLHYAIYDGGLGAAAAGRAAAELTAAAAGQYETHATLVARVTGAYVEYFAAIQAEQTRDEAAAAAHADYDLTRARFEQGVVPRADVLQAKAQWAQRGAEAIDAHANAAIAHDRLDAAMGIPMDTAIAPQDPFAGAGPAIDLQAAIASAMATRGALRAAAAAIDAARAALDEARAAARPSAGIFASEGNVQPTVQSEYISQFTVGLQAVWKLFDGGATAARIAAAQAGIAQARAAYDAARIAAELDVREAYARATAASEKVSAARDVVASASESARLARLRYREGVGTQLELQQAAVQYDASLLQLISARADLLEQRTRLQLAAGLL